MSWDHWMYELRGKQDFLDGVPFAKCPFKDPKQISYWQNGWVAESYKGFPF